MRKYLLLFVGLSIYYNAFASTNTDTTKSRQFLSSITSDTIKNRFDRITIAYDSLKRVVRISQTKNELVKSANQPKAFKVFVQEFGYENNNKLPIWRRKTTYQYNKKTARELITNCQVQYFNYRDSKRVGDSIFNTYILNPVYENGKRVRDSVIYSNGMHVEPEKKHESNFSQSTNEVFRKHEIANWGNPPITYTDYLVYNKNIEKAAYEMHFLNRSYLAYYFTFQRYDNAVNPLQHLNIAGCLASETLGFLHDDMNTEGFPNDFFNNPPLYYPNYYRWGYLNTNNPIRFYKTRGDTDHPTRDSVIMTYDYNKFKLPIKCTVTSVTTNVSQLISHSKRRFYFRYLS